MTNDRIIYLDNAATTFPKPESVYHAMDHFYRNYGGNAGRGANPLARKAAILIDETRALLIDWLNVQDAVFTPSATAALNTAILGARLRSGDVVYVSPFEHNSILRPLEYLRKKIGIEVHRLSFNPVTYDCNLEEVKTQFQLDPPAMICISQVSNVLGLILPVDDILRLARQTNSQAITIVDGAQAAGLKPVDTSQIDAFIFSGHKSLYGPYGIAGIGFNTSWRPEPLLYGGTGTQSELIEMPTEGHSRFEAGSQNIAAVAGLNAALRWLQENGKETINKRIDSWGAGLISALQHLTSICLYLPKNLRNHSGIISFNIDGILPQSVENILGAKNIAIRAGLQCSPWTHDFVHTLPLGGSVRISAGFYNTEKDIDILLKILGDLVDQSIDGYENL